MTINQKKKKKIINPHYREIILADRELVEQGADTIMEGAKEAEIALLGTYLGSSNVKIQITIE